MDTTKTIERLTTEQGCNVRRVLHEDGTEDVTLDTATHPALLVLDGDYVHGEHVGRVWP